MYSINAPPKRVFKASVGIDSVHLQIKGINQYDLKRLCGKYKLKYEATSREKYIRKWRVFLAGGQPITVSYHLGSKTMTFQIGRLMNYSKILCDQHIFTQNLIRFFSGNDILVSQLHYSADINKARSDLSVKSATNGLSETNIDTTQYFNMAGLTFCVYDKALRLQVYSTPLTRFELRLSKKMTHWKIKNFMQDRGELLKLSKKITEQFAMICIQSSAGEDIHIDIGDPIIVLENFIAFLQGDTAKTADRFKIGSAIQARDKLFSWAVKHHLMEVGDILRFVKGKKAQSLMELKMDSKTFNKAVKYYKGIPNFKIRLSY